MSNWTEGEYSWNYFKFPVITKLDKVFGRETIKTDCSSALTDGTFCFPFLYTIRTIFYLKNIPRDKHQLQKLSHIISVRKKDDILTGKMRGCLKSSCALDVQFSENKKSYEDICALLLWCRERCICVGVWNSTFFFLKKRNYFN